MTIAPAHYPVLIAIASLIVVPLIVFSAKQVWALWVENRDRRLDAAITAKLGDYVTTEALDEKLEMMQRHQDELHRQNTLFLDTIRIEGQRREGMILGALNTAAEERREDMKEIRDTIGEVHRRVDRVLELSGERRGRA